MMTYEDILRAGDRIGVYTIKEKLGAGGMCQVYRAHDETADRDVAIKVMPHTLGEDEAIADFLEEGKLLARLRHTNIVPIYSLGFDRGIPWMAMACIDGWNLSEYIKECPFTLEEAEAFLKQASSALLYAEKANIIHLDIKPDNFLVDTDGVILLTDFGIARRLSYMDQGFYDGLAVKGTATYASPEHFQCGKMDLRTDIYCLGVTLFQLITGVFPYQGTSAEELSQKHVESPFPEEILVRLDVPEKWRSCLRKMMAKSPDDRYQTYEELRMAFGFEATNIVFTSFTPEELKPKEHGRRTMPRMGGSPSDLFSLIPPDFAEEGDDLSRAGTMYSAETFINALTRRGPLLKVNNLAGCVRRMQNPGTGENGKVLAAAANIPGFRETLLNIGGFMADNMGVEAETDSEILELVGEDRAVGLALLAGGLYSPWQGEIRLNHHNFWENAIYTGLLANFMADMLGYELDQKEFICGIVHSIGRLVFMEMHPMKTIALWMKAYAHHDPLEVLEKKYFGLTAATLGAKWLRMHDVDPVICHVVAHQKNPENCIKSLTKTSTSGMFSKTKQMPDFNVQILAHLTVSASLLAKELQLGFDGCSFLSKTPWCLARETQLIFANRVNRDVTFQDFIMFFQESCQSLPELPILKITSTEIAQERSFLVKELMGTARFNKIFSA